MQKGLVASRPPDEPVNSGPCTNDSSCGEGYKCGYSPGMMYPALCCIKESSPTPASPTPPPSPLPDCCGILVENTSYMTCSGVPPISCDGSSYYTNYNHNVVNQEGKDVSGGFQCAEKANQCIPFSNTGNAKDSTCILPTPAP